MSLEDRANVELIKRRNGRFAVRVHGQGMFGVTDVTVMQSTEDRVDREGWVSRKLTGESFVQIKLPVKFVKFCDENS